VSSYSGFGIHTLLSILRFFPGLYKQFIFVSVAVVDSGSFKGKEEIEDLQRHGLLHNETSKIIQRRLQWVGVPMVVLPIRAKV
jgi:hypothetical protein